MDPDQSLWKEAKPLKSPKPPEAPKAPVSVPDAKKVAQVTEAFDRGKVAAGAEETYADAVKGLGRLTDRYGKYIQWNSQPITDAETMGKYLTREALKDASMPKMLMNSDAQRYFNFEARRLGSEPRGASPVLVLDAFRQGVKKHRDTAQMVEQQTADLHAVEAPATGVFMADLQDLVIGRSADEQAEAEIVLPQWEGKQEAVDKIYEKINLGVPGSAIANLAGLNLPADAIEALTTLDEADAAEWEALGIEEDERNRMQKRNERRIRWGDRFGPDKFSVKQVWIPQVKESGGRHAIPIHGSHGVWARLNRGKRILLAREKGYKNFQTAAQKDTGLSKEEFDVLVKEAEDWTSDRVRYLQNYGGEGLLVIDNPEKMFKSLQEGTDPLSWVSPGLWVGSLFNKIGLMSDEAYAKQARDRAPFAQMLYPTTLESFNEGTLMYGRMVEDVHPGALHWFGNIALSTPIGSFASAPEGVKFGSKEHLRLSRQYNSFNDLGKAGDWVKAAILEANPELKESYLPDAAKLIIDTQHMAGLVLEPDLFTMATLGVGYTGKAVGIASKAAIRGGTGAHRAADALDLLRANKYERLLNEADQMLQSGEVGRFGDITAFFRKEGAPELAEVYDASLLGNVAGKVPGIPAGQRKFSETLDSYRSQLGKTREEIKELQDALPQEVQRYVTLHGKVRPNTDKDLIALVKQYGKGDAKQVQQARDLAVLAQKEAVLEAGQMYAQLQKEEEILRTVAATKTGIKPPGGATEADIHEKFIGLITQGREKYLSFQKELDALIDLEAEIAKLSSFKKPTHRQQARMDLLETRLIPDQRGAAKAAQVQQRRLLYNSAIEAVYENYLTAQKVFNEKLIYLAKHFEGENATRLLLSTSDVVRAEKKLAKAVKRATPKGEAIVSKENKAALKLAEQTVEEAIQRQKLDFESFLKTARADDPISLQGILDRSFKALKLGGRVEALEDIASTAGKTIEVMRLSVRTAQNILRKGNEKFRGWHEGADEGIALIDSPDITKISPDGTGIVVDWDRYAESPVGALLMGRSTDLPDVERVLEHLLTDADYGPALSALQKGLRKPRLSLAEKDILADLERVVTSAMKHSQVRGGQEAIAALNAWKSPRVKGDAFSDIPGTDPFEWVKSFMADAKSGVALPLPSWRTVEDFASVAARKVRAVGVMFDPKAHRFGPLSEHLSEATLRASTRASRAAEEVTMLFDQWGRYGLKGEGIINEVASLLTSHKTFTINFRGQKAAGSSGLGRGMPVTVNKGGNVPWAKFKANVLDQAPDVAAQYNVGFQGAVRAWLPARTPAEGFVKELQNQAYKKLEEGLGAKAYKRLAEEGVNAETIARLEFNKWVNDVRNLTKHQFASNIEDPTRAHAFIARGVLHGSVVEEYLYDLMRAGGPAIDPEAALGANAILGGFSATKLTAKDPTRYGVDSVKLEPTDTMRYVAPEYGFNPTKAFEALNAWGIAYNQKGWQTIGRKIQRLEELSNEFIELSRTGKGGKVGWVPHRVIQKIDEAAGSIAKDVSEVGLKASDKVGVKVVQAFLTYLRLWRTSVILGITVPRPAYFANQNFGDFDQLWTTEGLIQTRRYKIGPNKGKIYLSGAVPQHFQNTFSYVPAFGAWTQDYLSEMASGASKSGTRPLLTTPLNAVFMPWVSRLFKGGDELVETKNGVRTLDQFMEEAVEDRIFDNMMTEDLYQLMRGIDDKNGGLNTARTRQAKLITGVKNFGRYWQDTVTTTQARQRLALYAEYRLARGEARSAARKATHDSFFDWKFGVTEWEMMTIGQVVAFYPFFRLAMKQQFRSVLEGLTAPTMNTLERAIKGQTRMARIRSKARLVNGVPSYIWGPDEDEALSEYEMQEEIYRRVSPWWVGARPMTSNNRMEDFRQEFFNEKFGMADDDTPRYTHLANVYPMWTSLDLTELSFSYYQGILGFMLYAGTKGAIKPSPEMARRLSQTTTGFFQPIFKGLAGASADYYTGNTFTRGPLGARLRPGEEQYYRVPAAALKAITNDNIASYIDVKSGAKGYYMHPLALDIARNIPAIGTEWPRIYADFYGANPDWQKGAAQGLAYGLRQWIGIGKRVPHNPELSMRYEQMDIKAAFDNETKRMDQMTGERVLGVDKLK